MRELGSVIIIGGVYAQPSRGQNLLLVREESTYREKFVENVVKVLISAGAQLFGKSSQVVRFRINAKNLREFFAKAASGRDLDAPNVCGAVREAGPEEEDRPSYVNLLRASRHHVPRFELS